MNIDRHDLGTIAGGVLIGSSLGLAAGFLLAPKSGRALRDEFGRKAEKTFKRVGHRVKGLF